MPEFTGPTVSQIRTSLEEVKPLIETENTISSASVRKINDITSRVDASIVTRNP
jgi:hypothetical protein